MMVDIMWKDPYLIFGILLIISHLTKYYSLLSNISDKIKRKRDEEIESIEFKNNKLKQLAYIVSIHKKVHHIDDYYDILNDKVTSVFQCGVALFIFSVVGFARNFIDYITSGVIGTINVFMIVAGAVLLINGCSLLYWNLKNK